MLKLPGENVELKEAMLQFTGQEVWADTLNYYPEQTKKVAWSGKDFNRADGAPLPPNVYYRVYQENGVRDLHRIEGELIYSPSEGLILPAVKIMERAWI